MSIPPFAANAGRFDPYKNFKFRILWNGKVVAGISKVSGLPHPTDPVIHRGSGDTGNTRLTPATWKFDPITLERGVTHDPEFENWANDILKTEVDTVTSLKDTGKDVIIELLNEQGVVTKVYKVYNCRVSGYRSLPDPDANSRAVAIEHMVLQNEGYKIIK